MEEVSESKDVINHPSHYTAENVTIVIEPIQLCEQCGFLVGNGLKYLFRYQHKGKPIEDLKKARFYFKRWLTTDDNSVDYGIFSTDNNYIYDAFQKLSFLSHTKIKTTQGIVLALLEWTENKIAELEKQYLEEK